MTDKFIKFGNKIYNTRYIKDMDREDVSTLSEIYPNTYRYCIKVKNTENDRAGRFFQKAEDKTICTCVPGDNFIKFYEQYNK